MNYTDWVKAVPDTITNDTLWRVEAYRLAVFALDVAWHDVTKLFSDGRTINLASQLYAACGSVSANIAEGYSRGHQRDRARFYEYALGSARETRNWYFGGRHVLGSDAAHHRISLLTQVIRLLLVMLPSTRGYTLHDGNGPTESVPIDDASAGTPDSLAAFLELEVPMPLN